MGNDIKNIDAVGKVFADAAQSTNFKKTVPYATNFCWTAV